MTYKDRIVHVGAFPIGIEPDRFEKTLASEQVMRRIFELEREFEGKRVMVGVDRLDYVKGLPQKLHAFELFLKDHPESVGSVVLIQIAIPTRGDVEEYQNLRALVNELIGRINGKYGLYPVVEDTPLAKSLRLTVKQGRMSIRLFISCISPYPSRSF